MEDPVPYGSSDKLTEKSTAVITMDSWSITLYRKKRQLTIKTLDYHAGPLVLTRDGLVEIARKMGLHVRSKKNKKNAAVK